MKLKVGDKVRVNPLAKDCGRWWGNIGKVMVIHHGEVARGYPIKVEFVNQRFWVGFWSDDLELVESNSLEQKGE